MRTVGWSSCCCCFFFCSIVVVIADAIPKYTREKHNTSIYFTWNVWEKLFSLGIFTFESVRIATQLNSQLNCLSLCLSLTLWVTITISIAGNWSDDVKCISRLRAGLSSVLTNTLTYRWASIESIHVNACVYLLTQLSEQHRKRYVRRCSLF